MPRIGAAGGSIDVHSAIDWQAQRRAELEAHDALLSARLELERAARPADVVASSYADFLSEQVWHWFCHFTFRIHHTGATGGVHPERADKAFRLFVSCLNRVLYGPRWGAKWHRGCTWARGQEFHQDGRIHFHAVLSAPTADLNQLARRMDWVDWWWREKFGICRIGRPETQFDVVQYICKYVAKDGEIDLSKNFGAWVAPPLVFGSVVSEGDWVGMSEADLVALEAIKDAKADPLRSRPKKR